LNNNPIPRKPKDALDSEQESKRLKWRDDLFGTSVDPKDLYLCAYYNPKRVSASTDLKIKILIAIDEEIYRKASLEEVKRIASHLDGSDCDGLKLQVIMFESRVPAVKNLSHIIGDPYDSPLKTDYYVQIKSIYRLEERLIIWFSGDTPYEIHPDLDENISEGASRGKKPTSEGWEIQIPDHDAGFQIDSPTGVETCFAVICPKHKFDKTAIKDAILKFSKDYPFSTFRKVTKPTRRVLAGKAKGVIKRRKNLGGIPQGIFWENDLIEQYLPEGTYAIMLSLPVRN
jgi:hypothetical protein